MRLIGKRALITGGGRGLGRAMALALGAEGTDVAVNYERDAKSAQAVVTQLVAMGRRATAVQADVADAARVHAMIEHVHAELGPVDILINNAGRCIDTDFLAAAPDVLERTLAVHVAGACHCARAVLPDMLARGWGRIINISSVAGIRGVPANAEYCTAKAAVIGLTMSLAATYARQGITVNAIAPGIMRTDFHATKTPEYWENVRQRRVPVGREGQADEVGQAAVYLCTSSYVTGEVLAVDGGLTMRIA